VAAGWIRSQMEADGRPARGPGHVCQAAARTAFPWRQAACLMAQTVAERTAARPARTDRRGAGLQRLIAGWAAFGITLSGATQLRLGGLPVGPSELMLVTWILFVVILLLRGMPFTTGRVFFGLAGYWLVALVLLALGALIAIQSHKVSSYAARDAAAFLYLAVLTPLLALDMRDQGSGDYHLRLAQLVFAFTAGSAALLLGIGAVTDALGPMRFWYGGVRFSGWAKNPNQMALAMVTMPFLGWYVLRRTSGLFGKMACALGIALCVIAGIATQSDSLRVSWVAGFGAVGALSFYRVTVRGRSRWLHISHVMIPALVLVTGVFYGGAVIEHLSHVAEGVYAERDQGEERFTLWSYGLEVISLSPFVGFGPGAYSGLFGPFQNFEAHNSIIDWGMSTGLSGIALHLALWGWCLRRALRSDSPALLGMAVSLMLCVMFGYFFRHPTYWTILLLVLALSERRAEVGVRQAVSPAPGGGSHPPAARQISPRKAPNPMKSR
jgi:O-antigen ligase